MTLRRELDIAQKAGVFSTQFSTFLKTVMIEKILGNTKKLRRVGKNFFHRLFP